MNLMLQTPSVTSLLCLVVGAAVTAMLLLGKVLLKMRKRVKALRKNRKSRTAEAAIFIFS